MGNMYKGPFPTTIAKARRAAAAEDEVKTIEHINRVIRAEIETMKQLTYKGKVTKKAEREADEAVAELFLLATGSKPSAGQVGEARSV